MNKNAVYSLIAALIIIAAVVFYFTQNKAKNSEPPQSLESTIIKQSSDEGKTDQKTAEDSAQEGVQIQEEARQEAEKIEEQQVSAQQPASELINNQAPTQKPVAPKTEQAAMQPLKQVQTPKTFIVVPAQSSASFQLNELLFGAPKTVVGTTSSLSGEVVLDREMPSRSLVKRMAIDARTFVTDSDKRDNQIRTSILKTQTAGNEFIIFSSRSVNGLGMELKEDTSYPAVIKGDLTIAGVTREVVFNGSFSLKSDSMMSGTAAAMVKRSDYGITIPNLSFIANVDDEVKLSFSFTAHTQ